MQFLIQLYIDIFENNLILQVHPHWLESKNIKSRGGFRGVGAIIIFPETWPAVRNLTILSSTTGKINSISNHFWDRWRHKYEVNLPEAQRTSKLNINSSKTNVNDIVLGYDEKVPWHFWRIVIVTGVLPSRDSKIKKQ